MTKENKKAITELRLLHTKHRLNRALLEKKGKGCCFNCLARFKFADIKSWTDEGQTAFCPECSMDTVIPNQDTNTLKRMNRYYFCLNTDIFLDRSVKGKVVATIPEEEWDDFGKGGQCPLCGGHKVQNLMS